MTWLFVITAAVLLTGENRSDSWEAFHEEDGIKLWRRDDPASQFVTFRGRGAIEAPIDQVAAVIRDSSRAPEWMADCVDAATLRFLNVTDSIIYHRTGSPVPFISDRDVVLKIDTQVEPARRAVLITFRQTEDRLRPPLEGIVRMPRLVGHWRLVVVGPTTTEVEYQVQADPGGALPAWLVNLVSKNLPLRTLQGLRRQVTAPGYEHHLEMLRLAIDWGLFGIGTTTTTLEKTSDL